MGLGGKQPKTGYISKLHSERDNITVVNDDEKEEFKQHNISKLDSVKRTVKKTNKQCTQRKVANEGKDVKGKDMDKSVQEMENVKKD